MYCRRIIQDGPVYPVSHGICADCLKPLREKLERLEKDKYDESRKA